MKLKGHTAIVTGSARGIGKAIATALAREGCNVVVNSRNKKEIDTTIEEIEKFGVNVLPIVADVSDAKDVSRLIKETMKKFQRIDVLVNNAGIAVHKDFIDTTKVEWDKVIDINLKGIFLCTKAVLPAMLKQKYGRIINISSGAGKVGISGLAVYCASKFGVIGFTEALAEELPRDIRVFAVCPGGVDTQMYRSAFNHRPDLKPEHIAKKVVPLCMPNTNVESGKSIEVYHKWM